VVDTQGRLWVATVHPANQADGPAAEFMIGDILMLANGYEKVRMVTSLIMVFLDWSIDFEKASSAQGFVPVAKRWVVERSLDKFLPTHWIMNIRYYLRAGCT
jgi:hypothetical protein